MEPKISVILTTHDGYSKYLKRAIKSVINQTFQDWELIVVKDGGKDESKVIASFKDDRIRYIHAEKFGSHPRPKNIGTLEAKADYISYLDADNEYRRDRLQALWKAMESNPCDVIYCKMNCIDDASGKQEVGIHSDFNLGLLGKQNYIDTNVVLARKQAIFDVGGWDESLRFFADWNLWVRMAKRGSIFRLLPLVLVDYHIHGKNNVTKSQEGYYDKGGIESKWHFDYIQNCKLWPSKTLFDKKVGKKPLTVAVFMLAMDRPAYMIQAIESMHEKTKYPFRLFVLDQGVNPSVRRWLVDNEKKYNLTLHLSDHNLGISKGSNTMLDLIHKEMPDVDIIGKVDDDCIFVTQDWLEVMIDIYERSRGLILAPYPEGLVDHPGGWPRLRDGYVNTHYVGLTEHVGGLCVFAPARAYRDFRWREDDFLHGEQDWLFSQAMRALGYTCAYLENVRVSHGPTGTAGQKAEYKEYFERRAKVEKTTKYKA